MKNARHWLGMAALLLAALCIAACAVKPAAEESGAGIRDYGSKEQVEFLDRMETERPVSIAYHRNWEMAQSYSTADAETVWAMAQALRDVQIEARTDIVSTDNDNILVFTMEDGSTYGFSFNGHNFEAADGNRYTTANDSALWKLASGIAAETAGAEG